MKMRPVDLKCEVEIKADGSTTLVLSVVGLTRAEAAEIADAVHLPVREAVLETMTKGWKIPYRIEDIKPG